jgi:hypothetical protein
MSGPPAGLDLAEYEALLRADFAGFAERAFHELHPETNFLTNWHFRVIAAKLTAVYEGRIRRLIVNVPPRHLKSHLASAAFPAWCLGRRPSLQMLCVSYRRQAFARLPAHRRQRLVPPALPDPAVAGTAGGGRVHDDPAGLPAGDLDRRRADRAGCRHHRHRRPAKARGGVVGSPASGGE